MFITTGHLAEHSASVTRSWNMHPHDYAKLKSGERQPIVEAVAPSSPALLGYSDKGPRGPPLDDDVLLTAAQTRARVGHVSAMCIWRWMRDPRVQFPAPIKINNRNYWRLGDLRRWQAARVQKAA
jgi:predicted DNA-binding transcriptional regulator AlpA